MNLTINPIKFRSFISGNNTKPDIPKNNDYCKNNKSNCDGAIESYIQAAINLQRKTLRKSPKQLLSPNVFFINMYGYGLNKTWAQKMRDLLYSTSEDISLGLDFDLILEKIEKGISEINSSKKDKQSIYGIRRKRHHNFAMDTKQRGREYVERYSKKCQKNGEHIDDDFVYSPKANKKYNNANTCTITTAISPFFEPSIYVSQEPIEKYNISNLALVKNEFNKLREIENPTTEEVLRSCAIIQWLIAQETPYQRGSDSIANVLTKSIMHANNIYISPLKEGVSLDFEAFDTDLDDYIERYPDFFEIRPYKMKG